MRSRYELSIPVACGQGVHPVTFTIEEPESVVAVSSPCADLPLVLAPSNPPCLKTARELVPHLFAIAPLCLCLEQGLIDQAGAQRLAELQPSVPLTSVAALSRCDPGQFFAIAADDPRRISVWLLARFLVGLQSAYAFRAEAYRVCQCLAKWLTETPECACEVFRELPVGLFRARVFRAMPRAQKLRSFRAVLECPAVWAGVVARLEPLLSDVVDAVLEEPVGHWALGAVEILGSCTHPIAVALALTLLVRLQRESSSTPSIEPLAATRDRLLRAARSDTAPEWFRLLTRALLPGQGEPLCRMGESAAGREALRWIYRRIRVHLGGRQRQLVEDLLHRFSEPPL